MNIITPEGPVTACDNLRPDPHGVLHPIGAPAPVATDSWRPMLRFSSSAGLESLILARGMELKIVEEGAEQVISPLPGVPLCAVATDDVLLLMTSAGPVELVRDPDTDRWTLSPLPAPESPLALVAVDCSPLSVRVPAMHLRSGCSTRSSLLDDPDAFSLGALGAHAYCTLASNAASTGAWLQPCIGFYRLLDSRDRELYRSSPVLLGPSSGLNCIEALSAPMGSSDGSALDTVGSFSLSATPYKVALRLALPPESITPGSLLARASAVEVYLTPQLHPVDLDGRSPSRLEHSGSGSTLRFFLPGVSDGMTPSPASQGSNATALMARIADSALPECRMAAVALHLSSLGALTAVPRCRVARVDDERRRVGVLASRPLPATTLSPLVSRCRPPHSFTARCASAEGDTVMWGDISSTLFRGHLPTEFARDATSGLSTMIAVVETASGDRLVRHYSGTAAAPLTLSPLLCYPHPDAVSLTLTVETAAGARRLSFPLVSAPGCPFSFSLDPTLRPVSLSSGSVPSLMTPPAHVSLPLAAPGAILRASGSAPLAPIASLSLSQGAVTALVPGRTRYALSTAGIHHLSASAATLLAPGCCLPARYAATPEALFAVTAGGTLLRLSGTSVAAVESGVAAVGWCHSRRELWVAMDGGEVRVCPDGRLSARFTRSDIAPRELFTLGERLYILAADGRLLSAHTEIPYSAIPATWHSRTAAPRRVAGVEAVLTGSDLQGAIELLADGGNPSAATRLLSLSIRGTLRAPIRRRVLLPRRSYLALRLSLAATPGTRLSSLDLLSL